ncbi:50S ribosomal protein L24 [Ketobacter alkanivorans]|uniref:Large ribosomal subunit protein uL24 n=1 Tax=Ketobacter alkanivorans TaxID=1917421 RepID=A0A2K9LIG8_9GAMM|nr:50S ribosomal protein L24 [Ketobacter alkanivorans]AUM12053.1 50S ribosomal protein L24 [Ketobacter alkanivorans]MCP5019154.1 50S ribosomal protein L24 [Ketobacter sp.]
MLKIKRNDEVVVIAGRDKGKRGKVLKVLEGKLLIGGVNIVKKHQKPNPQKGAPGGIVEKEAPIQASNVAIFNPQTQKADRVGFKFLEDGKKVRCFKSTNEVIEDKA